MSFLNWLCDFMRSQERRPDGIDPAPVTPAAPRPQVEDVGPFDGGLARIPKGVKERTEVYGDPKLRHKDDGSYVVDAEWEHQNLILAKNLPFGIKKLYVHRKMEPYLREGLRRAQAFCPDYTIRRIGCFNPRPQRHDPSRPPSDHTWAIAVDINSDDNRAFYRSDHPTGPQPFQEGWSAFSDIPEPFIRAMEGVGWVWGGRWRSYIDPMHLQLHQL